MPFPTRMVGAGLKSGDLPLHSPVAFSPLLAREVAGSLCDETCANSRS